MYKYSDRRRLTNIRHPERVQFLTDGLQDLYTQLTGLIINQYSDLYTFDQYILDYSPDINDPNTPFKYENELKSKFKKEIREQVLSTIDQLYKNALSFIDNIQFPLTVFRNLEFKGSFIDINNIPEFSHMGLSWSIIQPTSLRQYNTPEEIYTEQTSIITVQGEIQEDSVDWETTIQLYLAIPFTDYGNENEVRLLQGAPIHITGMYTSEQFYPMDFNVQA
jgi:hypothetical protein